MRDNFLIVFRFGDADRLTIIACFKFVRSYLFKDNMLKSVHELDNLGMS